MKKILSSLLCFVLVCLTVVSCSGKKPSDTTLPATSVSAETSTAITDETSAETSGTEAPAKWFTFNLKISSSFMLDVYGKDKCDAWSSLIDAVMDGKDTFSCVDKHTYLWMMNEFPDKYFPVLTA